MTYPSVQSFDNLLDERSTAPLRRTVVALCATVAALDGYDTQAIALAAPAIVQDYYGTSLRATRVGAAMGGGRIGGIIGPVLGGALVAAGAAPSEVFLVEAAAALDIAAMGLVQRRRIIEPPLVSAATATAAATADFER